VRACESPTAWACASAYVHIALLIQHATRMRHIVGPLMASRSPLYFPTISHKRCDFRKKVIEQKKCLYVRQTVTHLLFGPTRFDAQGVIF
jgi:hypothetical protein